MKKTNYPLSKITWEEVERLTYNIADKIKKEEIKIDLLVPILRGGMPIALLLSSMLNVSEMSCVHIRRSVDDNSNTEFKKPVNKGITNAEKICGANILIVDDTLDSKKTVDYTIELLKKYKPNEIYVAILYNYNKNTFKSIYSGEEVVDYKWIVFPWEDKSLNK